MNHTQAWQSVIEQMQAEIPKASFDTWLRDTEAISLEGNILTVGVRNAYARDWLENRVSSTVSRLLTGILNANVSVDFVVSADETYPSDEGGDNNVELQDLTAYRNIVHPDRVVMLDAYAFRLIEHGDMTPKDMSLWVGFKQAVYSKGGEEKAVVRNIPNQTITRFAMMSRAVFFRELKNADEVAGRVHLAGGHVEVLPQAAYDPSNRYRVLTSPLLTSRDAAVIESLLSADAAMAKDAQEAEQNVIRHLYMLADHDPADWINKPVAITIRQPQSIHDIVRRVLEIEGDISDTLHESAEQLYNRILHAFGKAFVTHYFLRTVVPALNLTHPQAWAIIILRDRCWYDHQTLTQKDFAIVRGGPETLAHWVGVTEKAMQGWLQQPEFSAFVRMASLENLPDGWSDAVFLVGQQEPVFQENRDSESEKVRLASGKSETRSWKSRDSLLEKMRLGLGKSETLLKPQLTTISHKKPQEGLKTATTTRARSNDSGQEAVAADVSLPSVWDLDWLFKHNKTSAKMQKILRHSGVTGNALVSWMLYAASADPKASRIEDPYAFALSQVTEFPEGPNENFGELAALPPRVLAGMLSGRDFDNPNAWLFNSLMVDPAAQSHTPRYRSLLPILLGEKATPSNRQVVLVRTRVVHR